MWFHRDEEHETNFIRIREKCDKMQNKYAKYKETERRWDKTNNKEIRRKKKKNYCLA